jgi:hypothetical protein
MGAQVANQPATDIRSDFHLAGNATVFLPNGKHGPRLSLLVTLLSASNCGCQNEWNISDRHLPEVASISLSLGFR